MFGYAQSDTVVSTVESILTSVKLAEVIFEHFFIF